MSTARNKAIVQKINDAFARGDDEGFLSYCSEDVVWNMVGHPQARGKAAIRQFMKSGPAEPPKFSIDTVVAEGDVVTVTGEMSMKEDGQDVPYSYCDVWRFNGDKVVELKAFVIKTAGVAV